MARLHPRPCPLTLPQLRHDNVEAFFTAENRVWDQLIARTLALPDDEVLGAHVTFPVADGKAVYIVTATKPLTLQHVPIGDGYTIAAPYIRGLRLADVQRLVATQRHWLKPSTPSPAVSEPP